MAFVRWLTLGLLLAAATLFVLYAVTGQERYKKRGLTIVRWTVVAAVIFFGVLGLQRLR